MINVNVATKLPQNFAERVLELESLLDDSLCMDLITDLNELYRIAIDYYIQFQPRRAQHFQKKMTKLLADPATLSIIENRSPGKIGRAKYAHVASKSKISEEVCRFKNYSNEYIKSILEQAENAIKRTEKLRTKDLDKQEESLQTRIMLKKCRSQQKIFQFGSPTRNA